MLNFPSVIIVLRTYVLKYLGGNVKIFAFNSQMIPSYPPQKQKPHHKCVCWGGGSVEISKCGKLLTINGPTKKVFEYSLYYASNF